MQQELDNLDFSIAEHNQRSPSQLFSYEDTRDVDDKSFKPVFNINKTATGVNQRSKEKLSPNFKESQYYPVERRKKKKGKKHFKSPIKV